jgi:hypothetical protein
MRYRVCSSSVIIALGFCLLLLSGVVYTRDVTAYTVSNNTKTPVTIRTDVDSALVIIDSVQVGLTPLTIDTLSRGIHSITLHHPDLENWLTGSISDSFVVVNGESITLRYSFTRRFLVTSNPFGADVFLSDSLIGTTPLILNTNALITPSTLRLQKSGFEPSVVEMSENKRSVLAANLKKIWQSGANEESIFREPHTKGSSNVRLYLTGATTILSGVAAAYFKVKADDRYSSYIQGRDPILLDETNRLDTAAAVALVATQVSFVLFTYFILSD